MTVKTMDDDSVEFELPKSKREFKGDDADPIDAETGVPEFDDINPRLRNYQPPGADNVEDDETDLDEEEAPEAADSAEEESVEEEAEAKPSGWKRRLDRSDRLLQEERENSRELKARLSKVEQTINAQANDETFARESGDLKSKIAAVLTKLEEAKENGETKAEIKLLDELTDLKADLREKSAAHTRAKEAAPAQDAGKTVVIRKVEQWMRKHPKYRTDEAFAGFVKAVDKQVAADGFDPETDDYYKELDKRVKTRFPEEYKGSKATEEVRRNKPPTLGLRRESSQGKPRGEFETRNGKVSLTKAQLQNMRVFGLDPTNIEHIAEYAKNGRG